MALVLDEETPLFNMADFTYTKRKIEEEEDIQNNEQNKSSLASRFSKYLSQTGFDDYLEYFNAVISFLMATTFAINTYWVTNDPRQSMSQPMWIDYTEIGLLMIVIIDFLLFLFLSENRILYLFNF